MKGENIFFKILASPIAYLSCFFKIKLLFFNAFNANNYFVRLNLARKTLPNEPDPTSLIISKEPIPILGS